jgi:hypothetical protein
MKTCNCFERDDFPKFHRTTAPFVAAVAIKFSS